MPTPEERDRLIREAQRNVNIDDIEDEAELHALKQATTKLHAAAIENYLLVEDKVALDIGKLLIVFFDDFGRTVRQSRILPEDCDGIAGAWADCFIDEMAEFEEGDIGPDYLPGGPSGPPYAT